MKKMLLLSSVTLVTLVCQSQTFWNITGNAGTNNDIHFLGTTDNMPLSFRINNIAAGHIDTANAFFGYRSGGNFDGIKTKNTAFGALSLTSNTTGANNTATGYGALYTNKTGINNVATGAYSLAYNVSGNNNVGTGAFCLYRNNSGSNNVANGAFALYNNISGKDNIAIGSNTLYGNFSGYNNIAIGSNALDSNTIGHDNIAIGAKALDANTTGFDNIAIGNESLNKNIGGTDNIALGTIALYNNTTGYGNIAVGNSALYSNTTGLSNSAFGRCALQFNTTGISNTAVGVGSISFNTTGKGNTAIGHYTMYHNTIGDHNVALGGRSLFNNMYGSRNTAVGYEADFYDQFLEFNNITVIGAHAKVLGDNHIRIGDNSITEISGAVSWSVISDGRFKKNVKENVPGLSLIKRLKPVTYNYDVAGLDAFVGIQDSVRQEKKFAKSVKAKEEITYTGLIAQDVEAAAESIGYDFSGVRKAANGKGMYSLAYSELVMPLIIAVQELNESDIKKQQLIEKQQQINEQLQQQIEMLKAEMKALKQNATFTSLPKQISIAPLTIYPNPTGNQYNVQIPGTGEKMLIVFDAAGRQLSTLKVVGGSTQQMQTKAWPVGIYRLSIYQNEQIIASGKFVKE